MNMKAAIKPLAARLRPVMKMILCIFFDRKYLQGKMFDEGLTGYIWGFRAIWIRNILRLGPPIPWPAALGCTLSVPSNIEFHPDDLGNFQSPGVYFQNFDGRIYLARGCYIAPNVGIITANHDPYNLDIHEPGKDVHIGEHCWIGMNAVVLPGVVLGPRTIVGAGAVVTKSFPDGGVVLGGVPARIVRELADGTGTTQGPSVPV